ncbi:hypothetical protein E3Q10_02979 [Wallemia mellicola]|uniref:DUF221-domain-containing protein n=1 Tax=Wallemia mellicola TaxID=1708541 RepID=A0A4T0PI43_9BASI|nr:hypothetical protein E3Q14_03051 [Wallemia mellicola]TIC10410.1 hypothetical protein E3Q15_03082 [Wallemia mellicola]TIC25856.1 hypothetical protein E3Q11_03247 [Wallemia mellicola]TIC28732.1 hypothetical protein E3Q10_02979 [Wallemia mellicola]
MADCDARCDDKYSSLLTQLYVSLGIGGSSIILFESIRRLKRRNLPSYPQTNEFRKERYIFGYLYYFRCFVDPASDRHPGWPLQWIWQVLKLKQSQITDMLGGDASVYLHWLKVCLCFTLSQTITVVPILLPIHFHFTSTPTDSSMNTASLTHLIDNSDGRELLYVHVILHIWTSITWIIALLWYINGAIKIRERMAYKSSEFSTSPVDNSWKSRTVLVTNIPNSLRDERVLASYFAFYLNRFKKKKTTNLSRRSSILSFNSLLERVDQGSIPDINNTDNLEELTENYIEDVSIIRKFERLVQLRKRLDDATKRLELAYLKLSRNLLKFVRKHIEECLRKEEEFDKDDILINSLMPFVYEFEKQPTKLSFGLSSTINKLLRRNDAFIRCPDTPASMQDNKTIWEVIFSLPVSVIEPFQPKIRVKPILKTIITKSDNPTVSEIHYLTNKVRLLVASIEEYQMNSPTIFPPTSTAFVTFKKVSDARVTCKKLSSHPARPNACIVKPAPYFSEIDWEVAITSKSATTTLRGMIIKVAIWGFILFYIIPMAALSSLFSIERLRDVNADLGAYFDRHEHQAEIFTTLVPTLLVAFISLMMPAILFGIGKKAQPHLTIHRLHDQIFHRYWVFMITNVLITFCIGAATFRFILESFTSASGLSILNRIYLSFPQAAPFFASWAILQTSIQNFVQLALIGLPLLMFLFKTLSAKTPRARKEATRARTPDYHVFCSNTLLVISVLLVMGVFNPLVIPFTFIYFIAANIVYRNQLYHVYSRRLYDTGGKWVTVRVFRYGMDAMAVSQVAFFAFHLVRYYDGRKNHSGTYTIIIGVFFIICLILKLLITRQIKARFDAIEFLDGLWKSGETLNYTEIYSSPTLELRFAEYIEEKYHSQPLTKNFVKHKETLGFRIRDFLLITHFTFRSFLSDFKKEVRETFVRIRRTFFPFLPSSKRIPREIFARKSTADDEQVLKHEHEREQEEEREEEQEVEHDEWEDVIDAATEEEGSNEPLTMTNTISMENLKHVNALKSSRGQRGSFMKKLNDQVGSFILVIYNIILIPAQSHELFKPFLHIGQIFSSANNRIQKVGLHREEQGEIEDLMVCKHMPEKPSSDAPDESLSYNCPFYYDLLEPYLLLPRDPTSAIDLDDLVEIHYGKSLQNGNEITDNDTPEDELTSVSGTIPETQEEHDAEHSDELSSPSGSSDFAEHIRLSTVNLTQLNRNQTFRQTLSPRSPNNIDDFS